MRLYCSCLIVVIGNYVDWVDYDEVQDSIADITAEINNDSVSREATTYLRFSGQAAGFTGLKRGGTGQFELPLTE